MLKTKVYLRICEKMRKSYINESTDSSETESLTWNIFNESACWDKSWKTNEIIYLNQIDTQNRNI